MQAHALVQYSYTGTATDKPLMQWLQDYTFPRESGMQDLTAAATQYQVNCGQPDRPARDEDANSSSRWHIPGNACWRVV